MLQIPQNLTIPTPAKLKTLHYCFAVSPCARPSVPDENIAFHPKIVWAALYILSTMVYLYQARGWLSISRGALLKNLINRVNVAAVENLVKIRSSRT